MSADREAAIREALVDELTRLVERQQAELAAAREREAKLREALREARPYIYGVASDPANALWRRQTAQGVLERTDAALADGEGET